jgi:hypothetical protein
MCTLLERPAMTRIANLGVGLLDRDRFAASCWYRGHGPWYYHRQCPLGRTVSRQCRYELIDPDLREFCRWLHARGFGTTPSCQGHFYSRGYFRNAWHVLNLERDLIRRDGLPVRDAITSDLYLFQADDFELPWNDGEAFCDAAMAQQGGGYLGIAVPAAVAVAENLDELQFDGLKVVAGWRAESMAAAAGAADDRARVLEIRVETGSAQQQTQAWADITAAVRSVLG